MMRTSFLSPFLSVILGLFVLSTPGATAQPANSPPAGITVTGMGRASGPAETATIVLMLGAGGFVYEDPAMTGKPTVATPTAPPDELAEPVIAALEGAGVPRASIELITNPFTGDYGPTGGPTLITLVFTVDNPSAQGISDILLTGIDAATEKGMYVNMTGALYGVADCQRLEREARASAIADARDTASLQAELLDLNLGDVIASRDDTWGAVTYGGIYGGVSQTNRCTLTGNPDPTSIIYNAPAFDPGVEPAVTLHATIELTFAIEPPS
jgi:uncharacterized protein YggE